MNVFLVLGSVAACELVGFLSSFSVMPSIPTWYARLRKPRFNPPSRVFGPVWSVLYALMGVAFALVVSERVDALAISVFALQLVLNALWTIVFFGARRIRRALVVIVALWLSILATILAFWPLSITAALLLVPYLAWVSFAALLNARIAQLNPE